MKITLHECQCASTHLILDIIIEDDSVKFGPKFFDKGEIELLKSLNMNNTETTYSIFERFDSITRDCDDLKYVYGTLYDDL